MALVHRGVDLGLGRWPPAVAARHVVQVRAGWAGWFGAKGTRSRTTRSDEETMRHYGGHPGGHARPHRDRRAPRCSTDFGAANPAQIWTSLAALWGDSCNEPQETLGTVLTTAARSTETTYEGWSLRNRLSDWGR